MIKTYISLEEFQDFLLNYIQSDNINKTFKSTIFFNNPEKSELCFQAMQFGLIWAGSLAATKIPKYTNNINDITAFINKMKVVFSLLPDEEIDTYNNIYNESTEEFITWINKKYEEYINIVDRISKIPNVNIVDKINEIPN